MFWQMPEYVPDRNLMQDFQFYHLRGYGNENAELRTAVQKLPDPVWGVFTGLFGMAANELYVVSQSSVDLTTLPCTCLQAEPWQATARPQSMTALSRPGLYVFRRFHVARENADELVQLSAKAWETFEAGDDYATEPVGLFRPPPDEDEVVRMQLVTWYDGFASWETSRAPAAEAVAYFKRRRDLTTTTYAVATRLVVDAHKQ